MHNIHCGNIFVLANILAVHCHTGDAVRPGVYTGSALHYYILSANCIGNETRLFDCPYTRMQPQHACSSEAGITCQGINIIIIDLSRIANGFGIILSDYFQEPVGSDSNCTSYDVRLQPGNHHQRGTRKLQICFNGHWRPVCYGGLDVRASEVMCSLMGYQRLGNYVARLLRVSELLGYSLVARLLTYFIF